MKKVLIIGGPTGIGKTKLAEKIAKENNIPIISADSRQIFKELNIGVAKPSQKSLDTIKYYEINSCSIQDNHDVFNYLKRVYSIIDQSFSHIIIVGGTGFYIKAILEGIDILPKKDINKRQELEQLMATKGIEALQQVYAQLKNPYLHVDIYNPQRLIRAIEIGEHKTVKRLESPLNNKNASVLGLFMDRNELYKRINRRVDDMINDGLEKEVKSLLPYQNNINLKTVGYTEFFRYFNDELTYPETIELIKKNTRNYAKRQLTFFKNQLPVNWFNVNEIEKIDTFVQNFLK